MTYAMVKEKMHQFIEQADEPSVLAVFELVESRTKGTMIEYSDEIMNVFESRVKSVISGATTGIAGQELIETLKSRKNKSGI